MDIKEKINKNKKLKDFYVVNKTNYYHYGFTHVTTLFYKNYMIVNKVGYINRTWECYQYQISVKGALYKLAVEIFNDCKKEYLQNNNIKRITKQHKKALIDIFNKNNKELVPFYNTISDYKAIKKAYNIIKGY